MRVTQTQDTITHAVFTPNKAIGFKFAATPEMFHAFTDGLYSNKPRAVAREVLCNAWDAHIEAGTTHLPIEIEIEHKSGLYTTTIKDQGPGIAPEMMESLYATMGGTNKVANDEATGGFGLGCKSPFCMVDHFEVTSCYNGTKTIYRVTKSASELNGEPGVFPIMSIPTTETGITVKLQTRTNLETDLRAVIYEGAMKAEIGGMEVPIMDFDDTPGNYYWRQGGRHTFSIRYGRVVYPLSGGEFDELERRLTTSVQNYYTRSTLIIQAAPGKIGVTPSRESISLSPKVQSYLEELITQVIDDLEQRVKAGMHTLNRQIQDKLMMRMDPLGLRRNEVSYPYPNPPEGAQRDNILRSQPMESYFQYHTNMHYFNQQIKAYLGEDPKQIAKRTITKLYRFIRDKDVSVNQFNWVTYNGYSGAKNINFRRKLPNVMWALNPVVILAHNSQYDEYQNALGPQFRNEKKNTFFLLYRVPRSPAKLKAAREAFKDAPFKVVDELDDAVLLPKVKAPAKPKVVKPKVFKGNLAASYLLNPENGKISFDRSKDPEPDAPTIDKPTWVYHTRERNDTDTFQGWTEFQTRAFLKVYGDKTAITRSKKTYNELIAAGACEIAGYFLHHKAAIVKQYPNEARFVFELNAKNQDFLKAFLDHQFIRDVIGVTITEEETNVLRLLRWVIPSVYQWEDEHKKILQNKSIQLPAPFDKLDTISGSLFEVIQWGDAWRHEAEELLTLAVKHIFK